jgi:hypothetical protein
VAFTYDLTASGDDLLISKVRMHLGDTTENDGVLPDGGNLQDAEITLLLGEYNNDIMQTVGACCALLARRWANAADIAVGPRRENLSQVSKRWSDMANELNPSYASFSIAAQRNDGYADYADDESEYT